MRITWYGAAVALYVLLASAEDACAWGPATHVGLASTVLDSLSVLPPAIAALLARHRASFIYGNIATDVVFAKRLSRIKQCCHHWSTGLRLLDAAQDERAKAFAYGYLSHLAADTVAHGKYVPRQIVVSGSSINFGHMYWELRADATESDGSWQLLQRVLQLDHSGHHQTLERHLTDTFLPYDVNRLLFRRISALTVRQSFRRTVSAWGRCSRWDLSPTLVDDYRSESLNRIVSILCEGHRSALLREDPNGTSALMHVHVRRREVRRLRRRGMPIEQRLHETSRSLAPTPAA